MIEKRKCKRIPVRIQLFIKELLTSHHTTLSDLNLPIQITDISCHGFGFTTEGIIPDNYYFNINLPIENTSINLSSLVKIIYTNAIGDSKYHCGVQFQNLSSDEQHLLEQFITK